MVSRVAGPGPLFHRGCDADSVGSFPSVDVGALAQLTYLALRPTSRSALAVEASLAVLALRASCEEILDLLRVQARIQISIHGIASGPLGFRHRLLTRRGV
jgi:hypothetical protein